jgi:hypothetical protein
MPCNGSIQGTRWEERMSRWVGMVAPVCLLAGMSTTFAQPNDFRTFGVVQGAIAQAGTRAAPQSRSAPVYTVGGLRLGSRVQLDSSDYREYKCSPSEQVAGFTWCQKTRQERDQRGSSNVTYSILHSQDGTVVYVNRFQEPALFAPNDADVAIRRYSANLGEKAQIKRLPPRPGFPAGTLATWGKVSLEILDSESISTLAEGKSPKKGYLIDFIGNFARSAKEGLPVYRIGGGAGFVWAASTDPRGRGTLRFAAIDPSAMPATPVPTEARTRETQENLLGAEQTAPARPNAGADVVPHDVALQEAEAEAVAARNESAAANRDAQLAKDELERLRTERIALNTALERSETERAAAEGKAHTMESFAYGTIIILLALLAIASWLLLVNRRKARAANHEAGGPETKPTQVAERSPETERAAGGDSQPLHASDMAFSPERAQSSTSDAATTEPREDSKSTPKPDAAEERVILPM